MTDSHVIPSDFRLHDKTDPLPDHLRNAAVSGVFDPAEQTFTVLEVKRLIVTLPRIVGIVAHCDKCGRWQECPPCAPDDVEWIMSDLGWRDGDENKTLCPICVREGLALDMGGASGLRKVMIIPCTTTTTTGR